jgi:uncharacterized protein YjbI with pentapeptide repeats
MRIRNPTGLKAAGITGRIGHPGHSMTVVAKACFELTPEELHAWVDDERAFPTGDILLHDDDEVSDEIRYANDFVHYKPRADLLLTGACHPPGDRPVPSCRVRFRVGEVEQALDVYGNRWWTGNGAGTRMTDPEPFTSMPLTWERAFGGARSPDNPSGRGDGVIRTEDGIHAWPLPNIEIPERPIRDPEDRPPAAAFGPIPMGWEPRRSLMGSYDDRWLEERWPWYPDDLDWGLFNAAPPPLQREGFLAGDEEVHLENIHPEMPHFRTRLPALRVRCFLNEIPAGHPLPPSTAKEADEWTPPDPEAMRFREVAMQLDTLWIDAEDGVLVLVWRGYLDIRTEEADEVTDLFVLTEPLAESPAPLEACRERFLAFVAEEDGHDLEDEVEDEPEEIEAATEEDEEEDDELEEALRKINAELEALGIDPDDPPELTDAEREEAKEFFRAQGMDDVVALMEEVQEAEAEPAPEKEVEEEPWTRERVEALHGEGEPLAELDLRALDLSGLDLEGADFTGTDLTRAKLMGTRLGDAILDGANLTEADLREAEAKGASFAGATLVDADLRKGDFAQGVFGDARLDRADLREADLSDAEFDGVRAVEADFRGANLQGLRAAQAYDLSRALFTTARATESIWSGATLTGAVFAYTRLEGADFAGALLEGADFYAAHLRGARFGDARLAGARLATADAFEADFARADLTRTDLSGGNFYAAEFLDARMDEAYAEGANLRMTKHG